MRIRVHITKEDIRVGKRRSAEQSPFALAISRAVNREMASVGDDRILAWNSSGGGQQITAKVPPHIKRINDNYDKYGEIEPMTFVLEFESVGRHNRTTHNRIIAVGELNEFASS